MIVNRRRLVLAAGAGLALAAATALLFPELAAAQPSFGGGGVGGASQSPRAIFNAIGNFIISEVGLGAGFVAILISILRAKFGAAGGGHGSGGGFMATCLWVGAFWCAGTLLAVLTGGANFGGGAGIFA